MPSLGPHRPAGRAGGADLGAGRRAATARTAERRPPTRSAVAGADGPHIAPATRGDGGPTPTKTPAAAQLERKLGGSVYAQQSTPNGGADSPVIGGAAPPSGLASPRTAGVPNGEFDGIDAGRRIRLPVRATPAADDRLLLPKGAFIDCTLETAIDSSLPGFTTCITATDTFGADGEVVLLERGTKLVGEVRGEVRKASRACSCFGPKRVRREGVEVPLDSPGTDELGRAGLPGRVNRHFWQRFGAAMLVSVIDAGVQAGVASRQQRRRYGRRQSRGRRRGV